MGMTGRFVVTKELLELSMKASQNLEMSENLDDSDKFKNVLTRSLADLELSSNVDTDIRSNLVKNLDKSVDNLIDYRKKNRSVCETKIMESGWMTFEL